MYLTYYELKEKPFNLTPDPRFLYLTQAHQEALAQLIYGIQEHKGFVVLTGEVGTGKTTLVHSAIAQLDKTAEVALLVNSRLSFDEILEYLLEDFGLGRVGENRAQRLMALNEFLIRQCREGRNSVVVLDEAQHLDASTLEEIRLLSNFETATDKLLQIVLVGQPELATRLQLPELRQLRQRIALHCDIPAMTAEQTREYILTRLAVAGAKDAELFSDDAISLITTYTKGIPRIVNMVCDHCLLFGYGEQVRRVDKELAEQAIGYLQDGIRRQEQEKEQEHAEEKEDEHEPVVEIVQSTVNRRQWVVPVAVGILFVLAAVAVLYLGV
jgi:type II secretory pathway predicted ATPase ExeA